MKCPFCNADDTSVIDSRVGEEGSRVRRRRRCLSCDKRFTTYETLGLRLPQVVKRGEIALNSAVTNFLQVSCVHYTNVPYRRKM